MLDGVARARLRDFAANKQLSEAMQQLAAGGFAGGDAGTCRGSTVAACLDAMWWSGDERAALTAPFATIGMAATSSGGAVQVVVAGADRR